MSQSDPMTACKKLAEIAHERGPSNWCLKWRAPSKTPHNARIGGEEIGYMRDGIIMSRGTGECLGTYRRVMEFAGANRDDHEIVVTTSLEVTPADASMLVEWLSGERAVVE